MNNNPKPSNHHPESIISVKCSCVHCDSNSCFAKRSKYHCAFQNCNDSKLSHPENGNRELRKKRCDDINAIYLNPAKPMVNKELEELTDDEVNYESERKILIEMNQPSPHSLDEYLDRLLCVDKASSKFKQKPPSLSGYIEIISENAAYKRKLNLFNEYVENLKAGKYSKGCDDVTCFAAIQNSLRPQQWYNRLSEISGQPKTTTTNCKGRTFHNCLDKEKPSAQHVTQIQNTTISNPKMNYKSSKSNTEAPNVFCGNCNDSSKTPASNDNTYFKYDILKKLKEACIACSCKVCECIAPKSITNEICKCKPCQCAECTGYAATQSIYRGPQLSPTLSCSCSEFSNQSAIKIQDKCSCSPCECKMCNMNNSAKYTDMRKPPLAHQPLVVASVSGVACTCLPSNCSECLRSYTDVQKFTDEKYKCLDRSITNCNQPEETISEIYRHSNSKNKNIKQNFVALCTVGVGPIKKGDVLSPSAHQTKLENLKVEGKATSTPSYNKYESRYRDVNLYINSQTENICPKDVTSQPSVSRQAKRDTGTMLSKSFNRLNILQCDAYVHSQEFNLPKPVLRNSFTTSRSRSSIYSITRPPSQVNNNGKPESANTQKSLRRSYHRSGHENNKLGVNNMFSEKQEDKQSPFNILAEVTFSKVNENESKNGSYSNGQVLKGDIGKYKTNNCVLQRANNIITEITSTNKGSKSKNKVCSPNGQAQGKESNKIEKSNNEIVSNNNQPMKSFSTSAITTLEKLIALSSEQIKNKSSKSSVNNGNNFNCFRVLQNSKQCSLINSINHYNSPRVKLRDLSTNSNLLAIKKENEKARQTIEDAKKFTLHLLGLLEMYEKANNEFVKTSDKLKTAYRSILDRNLVHNEEKNIKTTENYNVIIESKSESPLNEYATPTLNINVCSKYEPVSFEDIIAKRLNYCMKTSPQPELGHMNGLTSNIDSEVMETVSKNANSEEDAHKNYERICYAKVQNGHNKRYFKHKINPEYDKNLHFNTSKILTEITRYADLKPDEFESLIESVEHLSISTSTDTTKQYIINPKTKEEVETKSPICRKSFGFTAKPNIISKGAGISGVSSLEVDTKGTMLSISLHNNTTNTIKIEKSHKNEALSQLQLEVRKLLELAILEPLNYADDSEDSLLESRSLFDESILNLKIMERPRENKSINEQPEQADKEVWCTDQNLLDDFKRQIREQLKVASMHPLMNKQSSLFSYSCKSECEDLKAKFLVVRKISEHTVLIEWSQPHGLSVQGYELLVDGRTVQTIMNPSKCMTAITCLPHADKILLTIRTITFVMPEVGHYPTNTTIYRPHQQMEVFKYCRVCLVTDVKMHSLDIVSNESIGLIYSHLAQIRICDRNQHVCFECASLLQKYQLFKSKCIRAHNILSNITVNSTEITKQVILNIDRKENKLESCYTLSTIKTCYDIPLEYSKNEVTETDKISLNKHQEINIAEVDIKPEFKDLYDSSNPTSHMLTEDDCIESEKVISSLKKLTHTTKDPKIRKAKIKNEAFVPDKEEKCDPYESLDEVNDNDLIESSEEIKTSSQKPQESKNKKQKYTKESSDDDLSDNEPLSKRVTKDVSDIRKPVNKKNNIEPDSFNDYTTVKFLTLEDAKKELLSRKESSNYKRSPFKCEYCFKGYEAQTAFDNHMKKHSREHGDYECDVCYLRFLKPIYLCKHKLSCHKRKFICKLCPYICYCMDQARTHVSLHQGKKYPCKDCGEIFSMPNSLLMHKRMKHFDASVPENVCEFCGNVFGSARGLFLHNMKLHRTDKNNKEGPNCEECSVHFSSDVAWKRHLVLSTKHIVINGCKYCGERFTNVEELKCHQRAHHPRFKQKKCDKKLPAACPVCNKWLTNRVEYNRHIASEHPHSDEAKKLIEHDLPFVCEVCGQAFKQQCFLTYHQRKHTGERPYACGACAKAFPTAGALHVHRAVHARARPHACHLCHRLFSFKSALNKHLKVHLGIRPHKCTICDKGFIHKCDLKLHIKYVHDKVPWPKKKSKRKATDDNATYLDYN
ncbi:unnamed protein product [Arctia plantaginis]|uniref:Uncharacterized protein n=1 Tax=Arctia plantaginis TaxID=874455 RepID=A0A8S1AQ77_ARCPL|nr:unnamed protein product [Arctia plantaginis]